MVSGWDKNPGPENDYASDGSGSGKAALAIFALVLVAGLFYAAMANAASNGGSIPDAGALAQCGVKNAVKIAEQPGDPLVLAKTIPYLCRRELAELERSYVRQFGSKSGRRIFKHGRFSETMVEMGTAMIVKARMR